MHQPITFTNISLTFTPKLFVTESVSNADWGKKNTITVFHSNEKEAADYIDGVKTQVVGWTHSVRPCNDDDIAEQCAEYIAEVTSQIIDRCMNEGGIKLHYKAMDIVYSSMRECIDGNWENQGNDPRSMGWVGDNGRP